MWRPGFPFVERRHAHSTAITGRSASCPMSIAARPSSPGLVLGLDRGGAATASRSGSRPTEAEATIHYLREREQVTSVYLERHLPVRLADGARVVSARLRGRPQARAICGPACLRGGPAARAPGRRVSRAQTRIMCARPTSISSPWAWSTRCCAGIVDALSKLARRRSLQAAVLAQVRRRSRGARVAVGEAVDVHFGGAQRLDARPASASGSARSARDAADRDVDDVRCAVAVPPHRENHGIGHLQDLGIDERMDADDVAAAGPAAPGTQGRRGTKARRRPQPFLAHASPPRSLVAEIPHGRGPGYGSFVRHLFLYVRTTS